MHRGPSVSRLDGVITLTGQSLDFVPFEVMLLLCRWNSCFKTVRRCIDSQQSPVQESTICVDIQLLCRASSSLRPGHAAFTLPALCMRAVLDELAQHVPLSSAQDDMTSREAQSEELTLSSIAVEGELDARFVQLCCPQLTSALQVHGHPHPRCQCSGQLHQNGLASLSNKPGCTQKFHFTRCFQSIVSSSKEPGKFRRKLMSDGVSRLGWLARLRRRPGRGRGRSGRLCQFWPWAGHPQWRCRPRCPIWQRASRTRLNRHSRAPSWPCIATQSPRYASTLLFMRRLPLSSFMIQTEDYELAYILVTEPCVALYIGSVLTNVEVMHQGHHTQYSQALSIL